MNKTLAQRFREAFFAAARDGSASQRLREAGLCGPLGDWTKALTTTVVEACGAIGLRASAKGHELDLLPVPRSEYLALDVTAFAEGPRRWLYPTLVAELENQTKADFIAYALWKALTVRAALRVIFCYRKEREAVGELVSYLNGEVVEALGVATRADLDGETLLVVGTRAEASAFPHGFFAWFVLERNTGRCITLH
jgi:hypothetical protein